MRLVRQTLMIVAVALSLAGRAFAAPGEIEWRRVFTPETFTEAQRDKRLVILDLEAIWCHWCHVMDEKTYSQKTIIDTIGSSYIPVRIDQDARPDLGNRYREYGWPATIIFGPNGEELDKLSGFVEPAEMEKILRELAANPKPRVEPRKLQYSEQSSLTPVMKAELIKRYENSADRKLGGLKTSHKFLEQDTIEYALKGAAKSVTADAEFARLSLANNLKLLDPVWGGMYQYSTHGDWDHAHFEKIAAKQASDLYLYAKAYPIWKDPEHLKVTVKMREYFNAFLRDPASGAYYTSQDADVVKGEHSEEYFRLPDAERRKQGIPAVDKNIYASENGRIIQALVQVYAATGEKAALDEALKAAEWIVANRSLPGGGFKHGEKDPAGPYLCDSLFMGSGMLALYSATGDRAWLTKAQGAADFIGANFMPGPGEAGFVTSKPGAGVFHPLPLLTENVSAVRFLAALANYSGKEDYKKLAATGMRYLATEQVALENLTEVGVVLADDELNNPPTHITVVGQKDDPIARDLFQAALTYPTAYKRTEWWDRREGPMPNEDVKYPALPKPAAFVCTNKRCSLPIFKPEGVAETVKKLSG